MDLLNDPIVCAEEAIEALRAPTEAEPKAVECWTPYEWPKAPVRVKEQPRAELLKLRLLILGAAGSLIALMVWLLNPQRMGDPIVYFGLTIALLLRAICWVFEWYNYLAINVPRPLQPRRKWTVDILTTACPGEPIGMIVRTLRAMVAIRYPHTNYLCDEGNDPVLKRVCDDLGVVHVTRKVKKNAKAGNINNALSQATGEIAVVLDPDHEPSPYLLDRTLGYLEDPSVGFVQSVQGYRNQKDSVVARGAAEQSYHFYGPYMMGMHGCGTTQAIGANCVFRRAALDSIGGHAPGLAEDMHTSMRLYSKGWRSVYVPEILTRGLVPSTLAAFYKQQLKWACGVFDLLFQEYPKLYSGFTWRQRLHYLICPIFFLRGLVTLLEMLVPVACLALGLVAWRATLPELMIWFAPTLIFSTLVRLRVQRWLLEPHERGMHIAGGSLAIASWWVYLAGVICAVFRVKVPYIPTPKEDEPSNAVKIALPNFIIAGLLILIASAGAYLDSSPPSMMMGALAVLNAAGLMYISITAQQVALLKVRKSLRPLRGLMNLVRTAKSLGAMIYRGSLRQFREGRLLPAGIALASLAIYGLKLMPTQGEGVETPFQQGKELEVGGFYTGVHLDTPSAWVAQVGDIEKRTDFRFRIVSVDLPWVAGGSAGAFPMEPLQQLRRDGAIPMLNWLPKISSDQPILKSIADGKYDDYVQRFAASVRAFGEPVLICFAPQPDAAGTQWSSDYSNTADNFIQAWERIYGLFEKAGAANVGWVWSQARPENAQQYFPGRDYVDWIALPISREDGSQPASFSERFDAFRSRITAWHCPIMITGMSSPNDSAGAEWLHRALTNIALRYPEIKGIVLDDGIDAGAISAAIKSRPLSEGEADSSTGQPLWFDLHPQHRNSVCVSGTPGHFSLLVGGTPFYIKGIAYNPGQDWRDANVPLSSRQLNNDFAMIHDMGGNVIRRYGRTWSDRNIFNAAEKHQLKVMYGFWFMQDVNYLTDTAKEQEYEQQIESTVLEYRDHPGLLGWCLGNEVWGLLKHQYAQPYLTEVRHAHVLFVERMAKLIRQLDPNHPIFCAQESKQIAGAISDYAVGAPSLDVVTVNSYYEPDIGPLNEVVHRIDPSRPYVVSEFGPDGYWDTNQNHYDTQNGLQEATALTKAWSYAQRWRADIAAHAGQDVGGVAYCWSDRYEGTATWFGMVDLEGRAKPSCAAISAAWRNGDPRLEGQFLYMGPRIVHVDYPTDGQWPHEPFIVKADVQVPAGQHVEYRWSVTGPNFQTDVAHITPLQNGDLASIELPDTPGWYRIQLKVISDRGLDEANVPVLLRDSDNSELTVASAQNLSKEGHH
jgi:cellulose synthase (UDP-forming)